MNKPCLLILPILLMLSACASPLLQPFSIGKSLNNVFSDLKRTGAVTMRSVDIWTVERKEPFESEVRAAQCISGMADPVVAVIPREVLMGIRQAYQTAGVLSAGGPVWPLAAVSVIGQAGAGSTQTLSVPIRFTFISNVPNLRHRLEDETIKTEERDRLIALQGDVAHLIVSFDPKTCR